MKKQYMMPRTDMMFVEPANLLADSLRINNQSSDYVVESENAILSRSTSVWGDDEEENF